MIGELIRIHCPKCGQTSWIKEADIGRCPVCDKPQR